MAFVKNIDRLNDIINAYYLTKQALKGKRQKRTHIPYWFATALHVMSQYENGATFFMNQIILNGNLEKWFAARNTFDLRDHSNSFCYNSSPNPPLCFNIMGKLERTLGITRDIMIFESSSKISDICKSMKISK